LRIHENWLNYMFSPQVKVTIISDTKITRTENGDGFSTSSVFEVSGNTLTVVSIFMRVDINVLYELYLDVTMYHGTVFNARYNTR